ncbi:hypothetical protein EC968_001492 [Mortierella alpina]|nr:hypothetical protein EC968_001492 [Mortierella alpina]
MNALEQEIMQELTDLAPGFSRTMQSLMEHNFEHHQTRQKLCCEEIGETLFASLGGAVITTGANQGGELLHEITDDSARWELFQWSGNEWPIAKVECDSAEDLSPAAGQQKEEEEEEKEEYQDLHNLLTTTSAGFKSTRSTQSSTLSENISTLSDSTSKSESLIRGIARQLPSAPPPTRQSSIVLESPSPPSTRHSREQEFTLPSGMGAAAGHTSVTNQFHGGVHYHYANTCCHGCLSRQEHQRSEDPKTEDDDDMHPQHQERHRLEKNSQLFDNATSSSLGSSESRTCATSGSDVSASSKSDNSEEAKNATEPQNCGDPRSHNDTSSALPISAIPTWAKRSDRGFMKATEAARMPTQTGGGVGRLIAKRIADSHPPDHTSTCLTVNKPRSPSTKMDEDSEAFEKVMNSPTTSSHHLSQSHPLSGSEERHSSESLLPPYHHASILAESSRSLALKSRKPPNLADEFVNVVQDSVGTRPSTPPPPSKALRRMSRRRRHPEIQNRLATRNMSSMDVWQLRLARIRHDDSAEDQEEYDSDESSWVRIAHIGEAVMVLEGQRQAALKLRLRRMAFRKSRSHTSPQLLESYYGSECLLKATPGLVDDSVKKHWDSQLDAIDEDELWKYYSY